MPSQRIIRGFPAPVFLNETQTAQSITRGTVYVNQTQGTLSGAISATQAAQTITAAGTVTTSGSSGGISATQQNQTAALAAFASGAPVGGGEDYDQSAWEAGLTRDGISTFMDTAGRAEQRRKRLQEAREALGLVPEPPAPEPAPAVSRETLLPSRIALLAQPTFPTNDTTIATRDVVAELAAQTELTRKQAREALRLAEIADEEEVLILIAGLV